MSRTNTDLDYELWDIPAHITGTTHDAFTMEYSEDGSPIDLTGSTIVMNIVRYEGAPAIVSFSVGSGITLSDPTNGIYSWDAFTCTLTAGEYLHETVITLSGGEIRRYLRGRWTIIENR